MVRGYLRAGLQIADCATTNPSGLIPAPLGKACLLVIHEREYLDDIRRGKGGGGGRRKLTRKLPRRRLW